MDNCQLAFNKAGLSGRRLKATGVLYVIGFICIFLYLKNDFTIYRSFDNQYYLLRRIVYHNVIYHYPISVNREDMLKIAQIYQPGFETYFNFFPLLDRKTIYISIVSSSCGPACGELGGDRIEVTKNRFLKLLARSINENILDHLLFYELGRIYWEFSDQLNFGSEQVNGVIHTGFAVFMRTVIMNKMDLLGSEINQVSLSSYMEKNRNLYSEYVSLDLQFGNTLQIGKGINNPDGFGSSNLFASILLHLYDNLGEDEFLRRLLIEIKRRPKADSIQDVVDNFFIASSIASEQDLTNKFLKELKWPISEKYHYFYKVGY